MEFSYHTVQVLGLLLLGTLGLAHWLPPKLQASYAPKEGTATWSFQTIKDPKIGASTPHLAEIVGQSVPRSGAVCLVANDCSQCNVTKARRFSMMPVPSGVVRVFVVSDTVSDSDIADVRKLPHLKVVRAPDGLVSGWNVVFFPRVYGISGKGRFSYIQPPTASYEQAVEAAIKEVGN